MANRLPLRTNPLTFPNICRNAGAEPSLSTVLLLCLTLIGMLLYPVARAEPHNEVEVAIDLHDGKYQAVLTPNSRLMSRLRGQNNELEGRHYDGKLLVDADSWVRASLIGGAWHGVVYLWGNLYTIEGAIEGKQSPSAVRSAAAQRQTVFKAAEITHDQALSCSMPESEAGKFPRSRASHSALLQAQEVQFSELCADTVSDGTDDVCLLPELEMIFDQQFQAERGASATADAIAILNIVDGIYRQNLNMVFDTLTMTFLSQQQFSNTTDAGDLLNDVSTRRANNSLGFLQSQRSLVHLVTGRNFDGSTAGIAFLGVLCESASAIGTSQLLFSLNRTALVVAHEIGHNMGASHDGNGNSCGGDFIMAPSVNGSTEFSSCSLDSIRQSISDIDTGFFARPVQECFNFPVDVAISAESNPTSAVGGELFTLNYQVTTAVASQSIPTLTVTGQVDSGGRYSSVTLAGSECAIAADGLSYNCALPGPGALQQLTITAVGSDGPANYSHTVGFSGNGSQELKDLSPTNDSLVTAVSGGASLLPSAPGNLTVIQGEGTRVILNWSDNSNNETGFRVSRRVGNGDFALLAQLAGNTTNYTDLNSQAGNTYAYRVVAFNANGDSPGVISDNITPVIPVPAAPSNLSGEQGAGTSVELSWQDNSDNESGFRVERQEDSAAGFVTLAQLGAGTLAYTDTTSVADINYSYRVIAVNTGGDSAPSNNFSITPAAPPEPVATNDNNAGAGGGGGGGSMGWPVLMVLALLSLYRPLINSRLFLLWTHQQRFVH